MRILLLSFLLNIRYAVSISQLHKISHSIMSNGHELQCVHNKQWFMCDSCFALYYYYCKYTCPCLLCCQCRLNNFSEVQHDYMSRESNYE